MPHGQWAVGHMKMALIYLIAYWFYCVSLHLKVFFCHRLITSKMHFQCAGMRATCEFECYRIASLTDTLILRVHSSRQTHTVTGRQLMFHSFIAQNGNFCRPTLLRIETNTRTSGLRRGHTFIATLSLPFICLFRFHSSFMSCDFFEENKCVAFNSHEANGGEQQQRQQQEKGNGGKRESFHSHSNAHRVSTEVVHRA